jgi:hypothetical protein
VDPAEVRTVSRSNGDARKMESGLPAAAPLNRTGKLVGSGSAMLTIWPKQKQRQRPTVGFNDGVMAVRSGCIFAVDSRSQVFPPLEDML